MPPKRVFRDPKTAKEEKDYLDSCIPKATRYATNVSKLLAVNEKNLSAKLHLWIVHRFIQFVDNDLENS